MKIIHCFSLQANEIPSVILCNCVPTQPFSVGVIMECTGCKIYGCARYLARASGLQAADGCNTHPSCYALHVMGKWQYLTH